MFRLPRKMTPLEVEIESLMRKLHAATHDPEEYEQLLGQVERLHKMKQIDKPSRVDANTWALIAANLLGIIIIITHEYTHPITTKALNLAIRPIHNSR